MPQRWNLRIGKPGDPVRPRQTKFGGQPDWIDVPQWPIGRATKKPMRFTMQIELPGPLRFGGHRMAYVFLSDWQDSRDATPYLAGEGDNAVILQGGAAFEPDVDSEQRRTGPTLRLGRRPSSQRQFDDDPASSEAEVPVELIEIEEPMPLSEGHERALSEAADNARGPADPALLAWERYLEVAWAPRVGGRPRWLQSDDTPEDGEWRLLTQVDIEAVPCWAPFDGILYAFARKDGSAACCLFQET